LIHFYKRSLLEVLTETRGKGLQRDLSET